ncbi:hypothetical protein N1030_17370 [Desulfovibrio mangrovi]|uniref:hypothetical protein n=1 Tax=Desulfovibrio mangrovi TaxID=2976983 RepID=UPI0022462BF5|nr:hypothetical protein [Desulfovibrio mangrovi]UZP67344.1 hypothetical protein N1030_17370 [Desulfovibrio mangrovi]
MQDFLVQCRWPDGEIEYFLSDSEAEARAWAADARRDSECVAGVYGLLLLESPEDAGGSVGGSTGRYAGLQVRRAAAGEMVLQ